MTLSITRKQSNLGASLQVWACGRSMSSPDTQNTNLQKTHYPISVYWLTIPSTYWQLKAYFKYFPKDQDMLGSPKLQYEPYFCKYQTKHGQQAKRVPIQTPLCIEIVYVHYVQLQTPPVSIYHPNYPIKELQYTVESAQLSCIIFLIIYQSVDDMRKTNHLWYLTWPSKQPKTQIQILDYQN